MPSLVDTANVKPVLKPWLPPAKTTAQLDWAALPILDLSKFDEPGGKDILAKELADAMRTFSFWIVVGTGIPQDQVERMHTIGNAFFGLPIESKRKILCDFRDGNNFGYRENAKAIVSGQTVLNENEEVLNLPKNIPEYADTLHHEFLAQFKDEIGPFHRLVWHNVIRRLYILVAIALELPEDWFVQRHDYVLPSEDLVRWLLYHPRPVDQDKVVGDVWKYGHTDFGSLTALFSQPVAGLQIRTMEGDWKWVKPVPGGLICNAGDTLSFLTKGYIRSTVHRVIRPPADQVNVDRLVMGYFSRPGNDVPLIPAPSPVLQKEGLLGDTENADSSNVVTGYEYVRARVKDVHHRKISRISERSADATFQVKHLKVQDYYL